MKHFQFWIISFGFLAIFYILDVFFRKKTNIPAGVTVYLGTGITLLAASFLPYFGVPFTHMRTGRVVVESGVMYPMLAIAALLFIIFALSFLRWRLQIDYEDKSTICGILQNMKKMPPLLRLLTYFGLLIPLWIVVAAFSGVSIEGKDVDPWQWWQSGAGAVACYSVLIFFIASLLCLARASFGRWVYIFAAIGYGLLPNVSASLLGMGFSLGYDSLLWDASYWMFLFFYFSRFRSVVSYFDSGNGCKRVGAETAPKKRKKRDTSTSSKKSMPLEPIKFGVGKPKKIVPKPDCLAGEGALQGNTGVMWLCCVDGVEKEPIDEATLRAAIISGEIKSFDTVKKVGDRFWSPVTEVLDQLGLSISDV